MEYISSYASCYADGREHRQEDDIIPKDKFSYTNNNIPSHIDWCEQGGVRHVTFQAGCGCCWAFAVAGVVECINMILNNGPLPLFMHELVNCGLQRRQRREGVRLHHGQ